MLKTTKASSGLLFASFLYREDLFTEEFLTKFWEEQFGPSFGLVPSENPLSRYYEKEMGTPLKRKFFLTSKAYPRDILLSAKLQSMEWEGKWAQDDLRRINVDIGFLSAENFILATTKNYSHRIYLGNDIFSDLTYYFHQGELQTLPWTYPDYLDSQKKDFFDWGRSFLLKNRNN